MVTVIDQSTMECTVSGPQNPWKLPSKDYQLTVEVDNDSLDVYYDLRSFTVTFWNQTDYSTAD